MAQKLNEVFELMDTVGSDRDSKLADIRRVPFWWHTIDLGDGVITPGHSSLAEQEFRAAGIPHALKGKTVLDIGCWDGVFSFLCEERGAAVTAIDTLQHTEFVKSKYGVELKGGEGFRVAASHLGSALKAKRLDITQVNDTFDVTLFLGVLYHQRHPLLSLEQLSKLTNECAVIETHYLKGQDQPVLQFYPADSLNSDPTNYWGPSLSCVELMLHDVGFRDVKIVATSEGSDDRAVILAYK